MSYFDDASLVMIPSGYKNGKVYSVKPTDGSGDLTFTRASNATRVASNGLIEKVRTNLLTYSNTFTDASWVKTNATITANDAISPEGVANASKYEGTNATNALTKTTTLANGLYTFSIYVKRIATDNFRMNFSDGSTGEIRYVFNLSNETSTTTKSGGSISDFVTGFESLPNGWYRLRISARTNSGSTIVTYFEADNEVGSFYVFGSQLETGDIATDYIATTSAAVSVGPVSGLPRLDYLDSSCPRLLLEPQRTNLVTYSESFNNAAWTKNAVTISANTATSPDGYTNADKIEENTTNTNHRISVGFSFTGPITYTGSCFLKAAERSIGYLYVGTSAFGGDKIAYFNLANGTIGTTSSGTTAKIEDYGNGWYRCSVTATSVSGALSAGFNIGVSQADGVFSYAGTTGSGILAWGAQLESSASYPSSYIPTLGAAVTRVADAASKTGISSLIGQTEGTFFCEIGTKPTESISFFELGQGSSQYRFFVYTDSSNKLKVLVVDNFATQVSYTSTVNVTSGAKVAVAYKLNDYAIYLNGTLLTTDTSATVPPMNQLAIGADRTATVTAANNIAQFLMFKTRLTNAQLAELTA